jgi:hypothetical protein
MQSISETQRSSSAMAALALAEREDEVFLTLTSGPDLQHSCAAGP